MKKVVSFCLYGSAATYIIGMRENMKLANEIFTDWNVYIYYNSTVPTKYIEEFQKSGAYCYLCENIGENKCNWEGMFWRWYPLEDSSVDYWISRDADSRLTKRELIIVNEWISSGKTLHCIRDHRCHYNKIMGGLFGINNNNFRKLYKIDKIHNIISNNYKTYKERPYNVDQIFLNSTFWNLINKDDVMGHISNGGTRVLETDIEFEKDPSNFIGIQKKMNNNLSEFVTSIDTDKLSNMIFKIKNKYTNIYIDCDANTKKCILNTNSESKSKTLYWMFVEGKYLFNINTGQYLFFDKNNLSNLCVSSSRQMFVIQSGGFIIDSNNKYAVDIMGGLRDTRKQVWMYKCNYSEAQQWDFVECTDVTKDDITEEDNTIENESKTDYKTNILVLNEKYHHKNKNGLKMITDYLGYNLIYGTESDIEKADVVYCPSRQFNVSRYPHKNFVFGPHLSIFPNINQLQSIHSKNNAIYLQPSEWAASVWKNMKAESIIPVHRFPFPIDVELFKPTKPIEHRTDVFLMFKQRKPEELKLIEHFLRSKNISVKTFRYGSYKEHDYINFLKNCKYGIWLGRHESQGFALQEALSFDVPLLVWNVTNMRQQHGWNSCPDVEGTTIPFWDKKCGLYFHNEDELENKFEEFIKNIYHFKPREFILDTVSVKQCSDKFNKLFMKQ